MNLFRDTHVHSTFSDGRNSTYDNLRAAEAVGLESIGFADHVRKDSDWLERYVTHLDGLRQATSIQVAIGVECKLLDCEGTLDLPRDRKGIEHILVGDHRLPTPWGLLGPRIVREGLDSGALDAHHIIGHLMQAYRGAMRRHPGLTIAHPFSFLDRVGISNGELPGNEVTSLIATALSTRSTFEISERWKCPSPAFVARLLNAGVAVQCGTDAHHRDDVGKFTYVREVLQTIADQEGCEKWG